MAAVPGSPEELRGVGIRTRTAIATALLLVTRLSLVAEDVGDRVHTPFHLGDTEGARAASDAVSSQTLLLWGGIGADSVPFLEPVFVIDAPPALPPSAGEYRLTGLTGRGTVLFSLAFDMPVVADGDGSSSFVFMLPVQPGWEGNLASITLSGPGGSVTLDEESNLPMAILRNPRTGQIQGILRDLPPTIVTRVAAEAWVSRAPGIEVLFSRGIPDAEAWRR